MFFLPSRGVIKVERGQLVGSVATNFLFAYSAWIRWLGWSLTGFVHGETMCLQRGQQKLLLAWGVAEQTSRLPYHHLQVTSLKSIFGSHLYLTLAMRSEWRVRLEAINRSTGTVVVLSRVKNRDSENLLEPAEASKSCPNSSHFHDSNPGCPVPKAAADWPPLKCALDQPLDTGACCLR